MLSNVLLLIAISIIVGRAIGSIKVSGFQLSSSGSLIVGLFISYLCKESLPSSQVPSSLMTLSLVGFIASVGLMASKDVVKACKEYGVKFLLLALVITSTGALTTYLLWQWFQPEGLVALGSYVGALTSSPGLAAALELAPESLKSSVGLGYTLSYVPGILVVIAFMQFMGSKHAGKKVKRESVQQKGARRKFNLSGFMIVVALGMIIGSFKITFSQSMIIGLGKTGGVLVMAIIYGNITLAKSKMFTFDNDNLEVIRDISLNMFLAVVGLKYGATAIASLESCGLIALSMGLLSASISILMGYLFGHYILKIRLNLLMGGICGGMTSTPGLGASIECFDEKEVVAGYGATYPFALIFMIVFTNILYTGGF